MKKLLNKPGFKSKTTIVPVAKSSSDLSPSEEFLKTYNQQFSPSPGLGSLSQAQQVALNGLSAQQNYYGQAPAQSNFPYYQQGVSNIYNIPGHLTGIQSTARGSSNDLDTLYTLKAFQSPNRLIMKNSLGEDVLVIDFDQRDIQLKGSWSVDAIKFVQLCKSVLPTK